MNVIDARAGLEPKDRPKDKLEDKTQTDKTSASQTAGIDRIVTCPTCKKRVKYTSSNKYRPFCSERCQTTDLGAWAEERYRVPVSHPIGQPVEQSPDELLNDPLDGALAGIDPDEED